MSLYLEAQMFLVRTKMTRLELTKLISQDPSVRETIEDTVLYTYYAFYLLVILFAFLILPLAFFFHLIGGDDGLQARSVSEFFWV